MLMFRVAAQNVGKRRLRAALLGLAVMLSVGVGFAAFVGGSALDRGITASFARLGADVVVVPSGTLVNLTSTLLTIQPTDDDLDERLIDRVRSVAGVAKVSAQRAVQARADGRAISLIAYDPASDFTVQPWLPPGAPDSGDDAVLVGQRVMETAVGGVITICGQPLPVAARLNHTGVGPFDDAYFVTFRTLDRLVDAWRTICRINGLDVDADRSDRSVDGASAAHRHQVLFGPANCLPELKPGRVSALLVQVSPGASAQTVMFALGQIPAIKLVSGNAVALSTRQALATLLSAAVSIGVVVLFALVILISLLFSAIVQERFREIGLLRAMGARPAQIFRMILAEAAAVTFLGGVVGLAFGSALILVFSRTIGFQFETLGIPFSWPPWMTTALAAGIAVLVSVTLGLVGALLPAWRAQAAEPYVMIKSEIAS
jgi:putative ABC transport system permease protein